MDIKEKGDNNIVRKIFCNNGVKNNTENIFTKHSLSKTSKFAS